MRADLAFAHHCTSAMSLAQSLFSIDSDFTLKKVKKNFSGTYEKIKEQQINTKLHYYYKPAGTNVI